MKAAISLALVIAAWAQAPITNEGKPMKVAFECTAEDAREAGLSCSEEEPCPVYLELSGADVVGSRVFVAGNLHTATATLYSLLLASEDAGRTWTEGYQRMRSAALDQVQFVDFQNGWVSGTHFQPLPRDPFFLISGDGGKSWTERAIFDESRPGAVERFWFDSKTSGMLLVDAGAGNRHELYETMTGGESWMLRRASAARIPFPKTRASAESAVRLRADAKSRAFQIEKPQDEHWTSIASFAVNVGACKQ
jgi:photosystem II stability/assembly factor-like uncharacterized protein